MSVISELEKRVSIRAFKDTPVSQDLLNEIFSNAQLAPSNCNVQPWETYVVSGEKKDALKQALLAELMKGQGPQPDFNWSVKYQGVHRERQFGSANALYSAMGIAREDKGARQRAMAKNWEFFGAPHAAFLSMPETMHRANAVDMGIFLQTFMLLLVERGLASCPQGALAAYPGPVKRIAKVPEGNAILCGLSFGYPDHSAKINEVNMNRESVASISSITTSVA